jgi:hypothetical protein
VAGDGLGALRRAAGEQPGDHSGHPRLELEILRGAARSLAFAAASPRLLVHQTFPLGTRERVLLDQDPLALVASARAAEAHHDRGQPARPLGAPCQRRVAGSQEDKVVHVGAGHAQRTGSLRDQELTGAAA